MVEEGRVLTLPMPLYTSDDLHQSKPAPISSIIGKGLLPLTGIMLVTAMTESCKSVLVMDMCVDLALGRGIFNAKRKRNDGNKGRDLFPVSNNYGKGWKVVYIDNELGDNGFHERLQLIYANKRNFVRPGSNLKILSGDFGKYFPISLHKDSPGWKNLEKLVEEESPNIVVFDTLRRFHRGDENDSRIGNLVDDLYGLQRKHKFASILVHHESSKAHMIEGVLAPRLRTAKARGSSALTDAVDTHLSILRESMSNSRTFLELAWEKVRHQGHPRTGNVLVDLTRMYVTWVGGIGASKKAGLLEELEAKYPLTPEDEEVEVYI